MTNQSLISTSSNGGIEVTGYITSVWSGGFTLQGGSGVGYIHVYTSASTTFSGAAPYVNETVDVAGTGSTSTYINATSVTQTTTSSISSTPTPAPVVISLPAGVSTWLGKVYSVWSGGFTASIPNHGNVHVYTSTSSFSGGTPVTGAYAEITGTGSTSTSITAKYVGLSSSTPSNVTYTGSVVAATSYGFTLKVDSSNPAVPIVLNSSTVVGGATLAVGSTATVTGPGTEAGSIVAVQIAVAVPATPTPAGATPTPSPAPISQKHVLTGDYLGGSMGTYAGAWSTAAGYVTWAQTGLADANAISAAGIKTQFYIDPNRTQPNDRLYTSNETTFAHDCSGNRITDVYNWNGTNVTQYVMDVTQGSMQTLFGQYVASVASQAHFDAIFEDDAGPLSGFAAVHPFSPSLPCNYSDSAWLTGGQALDQASSVPIVFNGLNELNGQQPSLSLGLLQSSNTIGGNFEHCYTDDTQAEMFGWQWAAIENTEIDVANQPGKLFFCMERNSSTASSALAARLYAYASFLLTYNAQTSVMWEQFATPSGLHVEPESQLVALSPKLAEPADVSALLQNGGAYGREYNACYIAGNFVGACAVAVNPNSSGSVSFPYPQYTHTLVLSGGGIVDGGTIATNGAAPPTYLNAEQAVIAFP